MNQITVPFSHHLTLPDVPSGYLNHFLWPENNARPLAYCSVCYNHSALRVRLTAEEAALRVVTQKDNGPVWEDNCLEFFFAPFFTEEPDYLNFECNPLGAMIIEKGPSRADRAKITALLKPQLELSATIRPGKSWQVDYTIPFDALGGLYQRPFQPVKGTPFRCNFYLCGEKTPSPVFAAWNPVKTPKPDFHRPEFFGIGVFG